MSTHFDYIAEAHVTASNQFHGDKVGSITFREVIADAIHALSELDRVKKALFYGSDYDGNLREDKVTCASLELANIHPDVTSAVNILHGIVGVATEAGELLEALDAALSGDKFDAVNAKEEVGDVFWYIAQLSKACGFTFDEAQRVNIAKLRVRFPVAFNEFDANNRDLFAERVILEGKLDTNIICGICESVHRAEHNCTETADVKKDMKFT